VIKKLDKQVKTQDVLDKIIEKDEDDEVAKPVGKPNNKTGDTEESDDDEVSGEENSKETKTKIKKLMNK